MVYVEVWNGTQLLRTCDAPLLSGWVKFLSIALTLSVGKEWTMFTIARRAGPAFLLICAAGAMTGPPVALAAVENPLSPQMIVEKNITGKATIEFTVGKVYLPRPSCDGSWKAMPMGIVPKLGDDALFRKVYVYVSEKVTARLIQLGIENPAEHFRGKILRLCGMITRYETRAGPDYPLEDNDLVHLQVIRKHAS